MPDSTTRFVHALSLCSMFVSLGANADTILWKAVEDFPVLEAGDVPYYIDVGWDALAIDAAQPEFRSRFARAQAPFDGPTGRYDLELTTLGEIDGEGRFRVWVDGTLVLDTENAPTTEDFAEQIHESPDVDIATGSVIAVESEAVSNETIPENGGFAFARGRWRSLAFEFDMPEASGADVSVTSDASTTVLATGETASWSFIIANAGPEVATSTLLRLEAPVGLELVTSTLCTVTGRRIDCPLGEMAAGAHATIDLQFTAVTSLDGLLSVGVSADQPDVDEDDNGIVLSVSTSDVQTAPAAPSGSGPMENPGTADSSGEVDTDTPTPAAQTTVGEPARKSGGATGGVAIVLLLLAAIMRRRCYPTA